ncbi:hypothetical protein BJ138DRAFT_652848 [Hygrophoropsis aurantiaca]|uniref:Uncharacterized protein n=1 Tax=Hygrophoropsis aurantiaca TaxID=72124 RepID=A0ACB7ZZF4_9AGAM|nr:hypothetical protein BJ138DRAFT_652848 [Hygrophoropsis aurantiaca]
MAAVLLSMALRKLLGWLDLISRAPFRHWHGFHLARAFLRHLGRLVVLGVSNGNRFELSPEPQSCEATDCPSTMPTIWVPKSPHSPLQLVEADMSPPMRPYSRSGLSPHRTDPGASDDSSSSSSPSPTAQPSSALSPLFDITLKPFVAYQLSERYDKPGRTGVTAQFQAKLAPGTRDFLDQDHRTVIPEWTTFVHPEGALYFYHEGRDLHRYKHMLTGK